MANQKAVNVYGETLQTCSLWPLTGFLRDGDCRIGPSDVGRHGVCAQVTDEFLEFTKHQGNDLSTPHPAAGFPGLKPGDRWCLCVDRWKEAEENGCAPPVILAATHSQVLNRVSLAQLERRALENQQEG
ncbi:DUF2237 family protein [Desulfosarcina sp.]|uniref:DUF2237 family protein n=1 Tax=Desulfosarcina sp. TaxID=2027861 RepID=UPI003566AB6C